MSERKKIRPRTYQTFCTYCQKEFKSPQLLANHLAVRHPDTLAYKNLVDHS